MATPNVGIEYINSTDKLRVTPTKINAAFDKIDSEFHNTEVAISQSVTGLAPGKGTGTIPAQIITGPVLPALPSGTEYVWNKTDGAGTLLDILSGVA